VVAYVEKIYELLKPGGYWINFGPLLYHFADLAGESSIELSYEDLREVIVKLNFDIIKEKTRMKTGYTDSSLSMLRYQYDCVYFVARKPIPYSSSPASPQTPYINNEKPPQSWLSHSVPFIIWTVG